MQRNKYFTRFVFSNYKNDDKLNTIIRGKNWHVKFEPFIQKYDLEYEEFEVYGNLEVIIYAANLKTAEYACHLIHASHTLVYGDIPGVFNDRTFPNVLPENESELGDPEDFLIKHEINSLKNSYHHISGFDTAVEIAAKASYRKKSQFAIIKWYLSVYLTNIPSIELNPFEAYETYKPSKWPIEQVWLANSINAAYSAIEELQLQVKSSSKNPRFIQKKWNPKVLNELRARLIKSNINPDRKIHWYIRGSKTRINEKKPVTALNKAEWNYGAVRDVYITIPDAIDYASWLRSFACAHKFSDITSSISAYDVANCQQIARRLILESLKFWHLFEVDQEEWEKKRADSAAYKEKLLNEIKESKNEK